MDTDSAYMSIASKKLDDMVHPHLKEEFHRQKFGLCHDFDYTSEQGFFPRECCDHHKAFDKKTPVLFNIEAEGKAMIALCSKTYLLKTHDLL